MNVYFDLSMVTLFCLSLTQSYFVEIIMVIKIKWKIKFLIAFISSLLVLLIHLPSLLIILISGIIFFFISKFFFKENGGKVLALYIISYLLVGISLTLLSKSKVRMYRYILVITTPSSMIYSLFIPLFYVCLYLSMIFVDNIYRLGNYKVDAIISKNNEKYIYKCYFDTGNTLKFKNVPVIFVAKGKWEFSASEEEEILVSTINGETSYYATKALIELDYNSSSYFVYVVEVEEESFHGCEILLNAYLR